MKTYYLVYHFLYKNLYIHLPLFSAVVLEYVREYRNGLRDLVHHLISAFLKSFQSAILVFLIDLFIIQSLSLFGNVCSQTSKSVQSLDENKVFEVM